MSFLASLIDVAQQELEYESSPYEHLADWLLAHRRQVLRALDGYPNGISTPDGQLQAWWFPIDEGE